MLSKNYQVYLEYFMSENQVCGSDYGKIKLIVKIIFDILLLIFKLERTQNLTYLS